MFLVDIGQLWYALFAALDCFHLQTLCLTFPLMVFPLVATDISKGLRTMPSSTLQEHIPHRLSSGFGVTCSHAM